MTSHHRVLHTGPKLTIYAAIGPTGGCEAEAWLAALADRAKAQFLARFERLAEIGFLRSPEEMRELQCGSGEKVHEIKVPFGPGYRLYVIRVGRDWLATHGTTKPRDARVCTEATRARDIYRSYRERKAGGR
ncbi:hypothetical protein KIH27_12190 [Mycobacterium sp. M1]|uniref:Type II toxin-antitoxin system RelE/ParE family toxin n=1 Tax=Mycolicibacter acidiphilus TaxID=2835306 RepID=A0ABS5RJ69_9MYCO|nr:hypothetical protein [Mycolicibacter acidiphilus]MBS9534345.1 hypothetical protein [Mycolicibacter acidiphilus]